MELKGSASRTDSRLAARSLPAGKGVRRHKPDWLSSIWITNELGRCEDVTPIRSDAGGGLFAGRDGPSFPGQRDQARQLERTSGRRDRRAVRPLGNEGRVP